MATSPRKQDSVNLRLCQRFPIFNQRTRELMNAKLRIQEEALLSRDICRSTVSLSIFYMFLSSLVQGKKWHILIMWCWQTPHHYHTHTHTLHYYALSKNVLVLEQVFIHSRNDSLTSSSAILVLLNFLLIFHKVIFATQCFQIEDCSLGIC